MWVRQHRLATIAGTPAEGSSLVLAFGPASQLEDPVMLETLSRRFPGAVVAGCTTAGAIAGDEVTDDETVVTEIGFDSSRVRLTSRTVRSTGDTASVGMELGRELNEPDLRHVLVLSDGLLVNGSELARGLQTSLPPGVTVTGGLAADGPRFCRTSVLAGTRAECAQVAAIGLYGSRLRVGLGSFGGWDPYGPRRRITRSQGNRLLTLDDEPALELYKRYLGEAALGLPGSALLFPLEVQHAPGGTCLVRTVLSVDEVDQSLTFAGDVPQGAMARLMKANVDRLVEGASQAALMAHQSQGWDFGLLISCVGRRLVMGQRVEEELEAVRHVMSPAAVLGGFYSYGELCPARPSAACELLNQTMTITTFAES